MRQLGRKIYYDIPTGNVILDTGERQGSVVPTTAEQDIQTYHALHSRVRETYNYIELPFGAYAQDFAESNGYRVNPETKELEFSYPGSNEEEPGEPVFQPPLSEEVAELKTRQDITEMALLDLIIMGGM